ncbi:glycosyltransferase family 9 protein [Desulfovibrio sp.]
MVQERGNPLLRALDARLGPSLVFCAGLFKGRGRPPERPGSLAALCLGCIGDTILLSGPLADLAKAHPDCRITLFAGAANSGVARMIPAAAEVVALPLARPLAAAALLRAPGPFDALLDFGQWPRISALFSALAPAGFKAGFRTPGQHRHYAYHAAVEHRADRHEIDNFRALAALLGAEGRGAPVIAPPPAPPGGEPAPGRPFAVLHAFPGGSRSGMKEWPEERWLDLARALLGRGLEVLFSGGPSDAVRAEALADALGDPRARSVAGAPLDRTARLLQLAAVVVSVNTGIMHLAAALGAPLAALHGPTSVLRWGPLGQPERTISLAPGLSCAPCLHLGFEYGCRDNACMRDIGVDATLEAVDRLLAAHGEAAP